MGGRHAVIRLWSMWLWNGESEERVSGHCQYGSEFPLSQHFTSVKSLPATGCQHGRERAEGGKVD